MQQMTKRGRPAGAISRCFMPGASFSELAALMKQVLPPDTTGEVIEQLCVQTALWLYRSSPPSREEAMLKEMESMGARVEQGGPGSLGVFKVEV